LKAVLDAWEGEHNGHDFGIAVSRLSVMADIKSLIDNPNADLLVLTDEGAVMGFLGIFKTKSFLGEQFEAVEKYWYVLPENRMCGYMLLHEAKNWAKVHGCSHLIMSASNLASDKHDKVCHFYEIMKLRLFETSYIIEV
jgi:hypothetical protein